MAFDIFGGTPEPAAPRAGPRIATASFSRLDVFEKCPQRAKLAYIDKQPEPDTYNRDAANRGDEIHKRAERYIRSEDDDLHELQKVKESLDHAREQYALGRVEVEQNWGFDADWQTTGWFDPNIWMRIKCDVVIGSGEAKASVWDWKSGKKFGNEIKHTSQGQLYALGTFLRYPATEIVDVSFEYVDHGKHLRKTYTRADVPRLMAAWTNRTLAMTNAQVFSAKPSKMNCMYCPFSDNRGGSGVCQWRVPA